MCYSEDDFRKLLNALADDLLNAGHHFRLYRNLQDSLQDYAREINQCVNFWGLTLTAHREVSILSLCRAYDNRKQGTLSLKQLLQIIKGNKELFDISRFQSRLAQIPRTPTPEQIEQDVKFVRNENPLVRKLTILRGNFVAHRNIKTALAEKDDPDPLTWNEFEDLVVKGLEIFNKYRYMFDSSSHYPKLMGEEDYKTVLKYVRLGGNAVKFANQITPDVYDAGRKAIDFKQQINQEFYNY